MTIGKIFGFGFTGLRFDSQRYNPIFGQNNNSVTNIVPMYSIMLPPNNDTIINVKYAIPPKPQNDNDSNTNEPPALKYAIPPRPQDDNDSNTNEPPALKYAIPPRPQDDNDSNTNEPPAVKYGIPKK